jgi:hypothetical protein
MVQKLFFFLLYNLRIFFNKHILKKKILEIYVLRRLFLKKKILAMGQVDAFFFHKFAMGAG